MQSQEQSKKISTPKINDNENIKITSFFKEDGKTIQQIMDELFKNYYINKL